MAELGLQLELYEHHVIQLLGGFGVLPFTYFGGGAGYAYELELVPGIVRLELGGVLGGFFMLTEDEEGDDTGGLFILLLRPALHVGYKYAFFTVGPMVLFGTNVAGGVSGGFLFRI